MRSIKLPSWISRLLGIDPMAPPPHVFALDENELRYGCFHSSPQGLTFEICHREPLPQGIFATGVLGGPLQNTRQFWEVLQNLMARLPEPIEQASLVLPDTWLRLVFMESGELPEARGERDEVLRFKLKRQIPFRIEDLRVSDLEVTPFPNQEEPHRLLIGFGIETLMKQLEDAFRGVGIEIGQITNNTLALLSSLQPLVAEDDLVALVMAHDNDFTLSYLYGGEILLYRYKAFGDETAGPHEAFSSAFAGSVRRDLRLTTNFLRQHFPDRDLTRLLLAASPEAENDWLDWLAGELDVTPEPLGFEHFPLSRTQASESWIVTGPLLGAATIEVT